jgi:hypothetical protein
MRSTVTLAALAAGAGASPILHARQLFGPVNGTATLYSEPGCRTILAKRVAIKSGCITLDIPVDSVMFHGNTGLEGVPWERELNNHILTSRRGR